MNNKFDPKPERERQSPEPSNQPPEVPPSGAGQDPSAEDLMRQIVELRKRGDDPARLRKLEAAFDAEQLRQINEQMALRHEKDKATLEVLTRVSSEFEKLFAAESNRTDLTIREGRLLQRVKSEAIREHRKWLLDEKRRLMQKRVPTKRT